MLVFEERGKSEYPEKNLLKQGQEPMTNSNPHTMLSLGIEPRPHWWEVGALDTTAPSLLSILFLFFFFLGGGGGGGRGWLVYWRKFCISKLFRFDKKKKTA